MKGFRVSALKFLYTLVLVTIVTVSLSACAQNQPAKSAENEAFSADGVIPAGRTLSGSYLAGRFAQRQQDWDAAQSYMGEVLEHDRGNALLAQRAFLLALGAGNVVKARELAERIVSTDSNAELALIFLGCDALSRDDFTAAAAYLEKLPAEGFGQYTKPLLTAWSLAGMGKKNEALKLLAAHITADDPTYIIHAGMIEEFSGDMNAAAAHYKAAMADGLDLPTAVMVGNFYERYGQPEMARNIYRSLERAYPFNPYVSALAHRDPQRVIPPNVARAADGASIALFNLASLLYEKRAYDSAQIYGSLTEMLNGKSPFTKMMMGDIAALHDQYGKAIAYYNAIGKDDPVYSLSRIRVAEIYESSGRIEEALGLLTDISKDSTTRVQAQISLGDTYRRHDRLEEAVAAYDQALAGESLTEAHWPIIYARGIAKAELNQWDRAEKDLLQALEFQPKNPMILNFIAYSWANQGIHLDKALEFVQHAAALRPNDGYILDSYGWTLFRMARYEESIALMEMAIEQIPNDSTLLDHLGDAYWQVGRKDEARYQWKHATDLSKDAAFKSVVERKLKYGIVVPGQIEHQQAKL